HAFNYPLFYLHSLLHLLFFLLMPPPPLSTLFPYTTLFRSLYVTSFGFLAVAGLAAFVFGALMLFDSSKSDIKVPRGMIASTGNLDRKSTRLNSSHRTISYAVFCLKKKKKKSLRNQRYTS